VPAPGGKLPAPPVQCAKGRPVGRPFGVVRRSDSYFFLPFFDFLAGFFALAGFLAAFFMAIVPP